MSLTIPKDLNFPIASRVRDPKDLIALGGTNKAWRTIVNDVLRTRIETIFGKSFIGVREAVTAAAEIWAPLKPRTTQLSRVLELQNNPISHGMKRIIKAASSGSIDELELAIQALKDRSELTELKFGATQRTRSDRNGVATPINLLSLAIQSGYIGKVHALLDCSTPIGVGIGGVFTTKDTPVMVAAIKGYDGILRLLLEKGASFSVKVDECIDSPYREMDYVPSELLYLMFESMRDSRMSDDQVRCATLAMRSWRHKRDFETIQHDPRLQKIATEYSSRAGDIRIIQLLKAYGVEASEQKFPAGIDIRLLDF